MPVSRRQLYDTHSNRAEQTTSDSANIRRMVVKTAVRPYQALSDYWNVL